MKLKLDGTWQDVFTILTLLFFWAVGIYSFAGYLCEIIVKWANSGATP